MDWAVFRSQHTYSNDFSIWKDCQRVVSVLKKNVNMKQKANEEEKNLAMINNSLQDSTITPKISPLLKALI